MLYDRTAHDRPTWLKSGFTDQDIAVVGHTDANLGSRHDIAEVWVAFFSRSQR